MHRILLIDDDTKLASLLGRYFEQFGLELKSAVLPSKGLSLLAQNTFDLVILDIMLPETDGFDVCKAIRKDSDIPIIMLTARGEVMDRVVAGCRRLPAETVRTTRISRPNTGYSKAHASEEYGPEGTE